MSNVRQSTVLIYDGGDFERLAELRRLVALAEGKARIAEASGTARAGDDEGGDVQAARDTYDAFVREAAERAEEWVIEAIGHVEFRDLLTKHPPRTTLDTDGSEIVEPDDQPFGVNTLTFPKALLEYVDDEDDEIRTIAQPEFGGEADRRKRLKRLAAGEYDTLWIRALNLNRGVIGDPKLAMFSPGSPS